ncbi:MAG: hypothetical protein JO257_22760 [Deltaproteobacteria bacterium]|nr:hypothetical protein [Deltaproteobacteria bacterium]
MSDWYDPTSWGADWFGGMTAGKPSDYAGQTQYQDRNNIQNIIQQGINGVNNRQTPQASGYSPYSGMQMDQARQLQAIASGQQQGAGELGVQRQVQNALAGQQAMARMARGGNAGMAQLAASRNAAGIGLSGAGMAQQAAMQDQTNAQGLLANVVGQGRQQDQALQIANVDAQLRAMGLNDQARLGYLQQYTGMDANQLQAMIQAYGYAKGATGIAPALFSQAGQTLGQVAGMAAKAGAA